jgi:hypothetical protein
MSVPSNSTGDHTGQRHIQGGELQHHGAPSQSMGPSSGILMSHGASSAFDARVPQTSMVPSNDMMNASGSPILYEPHRNQQIPPTKPMDPQYFSALNSGGGSMMAHAHHTPQQFHPVATKGTGFNQDCNIPTDSFTPPGVALHGVSDANTFFMPLNS